MDVAGSSAVTLFVRRPVSDARSRTVVATPVSGGVPVTPVAILFVRRPVSDARSRTLVVTPVPEGAAVNSAVILLVGRPASDWRSRTLVVTLVPGGAAVWRLSGRRASKSSGDVLSGTVNRLIGFCMGALLPILLTPVGRVTSVKSPCR